METYSASLDAFLKASENTESGFAALIGKTQPAVNRYRNGDRFPDAETAHAIDQHTNGKVPFALWQREFMSRSGIPAAPQDRAA